MAAPACTRSWSTLPCIRAKHVGGPLIRGQRTAPEASVVPTLRVLPMGWSWSRRFCQSVLESIGQMAGDVDSDATVDRWSHPCLGSEQVLHARYVDNFLNIGHEPETVVFANDKISQAPNDQDLLVNDLRFGLRWSETNHVSVPQKNVEAAVRHLLCASLPDHSPEVHWNILWATSLGLPSHGEQLRVFCTLLTPSFIRCLGSPRAFFGIASAGSWAGSSPFS